MPWDFFYSSLTYLLFVPQDFESLKEGPSEGVYVYGLYLDGCAWSSREDKLVDSEPKKLYNALPVLFVTGVLVSRTWLEQDGVG